VRIRRLAAVSGALAVAALVPALPASAHGAPTTPISRTAACAAGGGTATGTAACKAARKANGGPFGTFDNLRVPNVNGDDRKFVPDGKLCSGGLPGFQGLDLPRDDFPSTPVTSGEKLRVKYVATLPHEGTFRIYITKAGFNPKKRLKWDDLGGSPIATVKDPPLRDGSYVMSAKLPKRTGRHILYIVWQTSSTVDTYYSCSDLVFAPAAPPAAPAAASTTPKPRASTKSSTGRAAGQTTGRTDSKASGQTTPKAAGAPAPPVDARNIVPLGDESRVTLGHQIVAGALLLAALVVLVAGLGGILRKRRENR
jgi:predicted carbohydrate-binding protein with CBM5 and CBM33 domain